MAVAFSYPTWFTKLHDTKQIDIAVQTGFWEIYSHKGYIEI